MAKNRDRAQNLPGGKASTIGGVAGGSGKYEDENEQEDNGAGEDEGFLTPTGMEMAVELKSSEKNRLQRAEMHLGFLIQEITAMANEGALVGQFRKACAECRVVFNDSNAALWQPLKSVGAVLQVMKKVSGS